MPAFSTGPFPSGFMGLAHDRYAEIYGCCDGLNMVYPYSHGYVNQRVFEPDAPISSRWHTIMTSNSQQCYDAGFRCAPLLRFSNPDLTYKGDAMGVPGDEPSSSVDGPADARRSLNETRRFVANFRVSPCLRGGEPIWLQASNGQYVVAEGNGGGDVFANRPRGEPWGRFTIVDHNGGCVEAGDTVSFHTSDGFYLRAGQGSGATLDATVRQATPWARFVARRHRGSGPIRSGDLLTLQAESGHYVWAEDGGGGGVRVDRDRPGEWGRFKISAAGRPTRPTSEPAASDRAALVSLHGHTDGQNWTSSTNWLSEEPHSTWYGITTDESGRVTEVNLAENGLRGTIPVGLGNLSELESLRLHANLLTGVVPADLTRIPLRRFWVHLTRACVPADASFQTWVGTIQDFRGGTCGHDALWSFTDATLTPGESRIRSAHVEDLRAAVNLVRTECGIPRATWTDPVVRAGETPVKAVHLGELRSALTQAYRACTQTPPTFTDDPLIRGVTPVRAVHWTELRDAVASVLELTVP